MRRSVAPRLAAVSVLAVLLAVAACTRPAETRAPRAGSPGTASPTPRMGRGPAAGVLEAGRREAVTLSGHDPRLRVRVTPLRVFDPAKPDPNLPPERGNRLVSVEIRLENVGEVVYRDAPANGAKVEDDRGRPYDAEFTDSRSCRPFRGAAVRIRPGGERTGCATFELPGARRPSAFTFALDSGFGPEMGRWPL